MSSEPAEPFSSTRAYASARAKLLVCCAAGIVTGTTAAILGTGREAPLIGWGTLAALCCAWVWASVWHMDADGTATHSKGENPGRDLADVILLGASVASLVAGLAKWPATTSMG
jgi:hypothetical protein